MESRGTSWQKYSLIWRHIFKLSRFMRYWYGCKETPNIFFYHFSYFLEVLKKSLCLSSLFYILHFFININTFLLHYKVSKTALISLESPFQPTISSETPPKHKDQLNHGGSCQLSNFGFHTFEKLKNYLFLKKLCD